MSHSRRYPKLRFHCPAPPQIDPAERQTWCEHCERHVHNLSAMSETEQATLLAKEPEACISYRQALPVAVVLAMGLGSASPALAEGDTLALEDDVELTTVTVGGAARIVPALFKDSALAEPVYADSPQSTDNELPASPTQRGDQ